MWVKCRICGENTYVSPAQQDDPSAYICPACREATRRRAQARRERTFLIVTALVLIGPLIYLVTRGGAASFQLCWGGLLLLAVAFFFTWRRRARP